MDLIAANEKFDTENQVDLEVSSGSEDDDDLGKPGISNMEDDPMLKSGDVVSPVEWAVRMTLLGGKFNKSNH